MANNREEIVDLFLRIGLDAKTANNTVANHKVTANLKAVIQEAAVTDHGCSKAVGNLLYTVATKFPANALSPAQLEAAHAYLGRLGSEKIQLNEFEEACGVGVEDTILEMRYRFNVGELFGKIRAMHPWADTQIVKKVIDDRLYNAKPVKKKKDKLSKEEDVKVKAVQTPEEELNPFTIFPGPEENTKVHTEIFFSDCPVLRACNTKEMLKKHMEVTSGRVFTHFPPEPNGYLHIGHAKAMFVNFGLAKERGGCCYLRYDDTNPDAEKNEYIDHIEEIVQWMGWKPFRITYTSDYFQVLCDYAVELIKKSHAYVDHQSAEEIKVSRENKRNSPWRDRPIEESLKLFNDMKMGLIEENKTTLRMKQDMQSDNFNMYDLIAYRIKVIPHPRTGDKWCIYPSYDYAHCIVDTLEDITHSLCTPEFETRCASYYWLLDALSLCQPYVWEYSRLNITNAVMSKCKLNKLVTEKWVNGWDDPRLMTLAGLRRRGVGVGITRSDNSTIRLDRLEYHIREDLNKTAARQMVVLHPLKVVITNLDGKAILYLDAKKWPDALTDDASAFYKVPFTNVVYIERSDFRTKDSKDYYGLASGKSVLLRYAYPIKCTEVIYSDDGETVMEILAEYDVSKNTKPKGVLHWVAQPSPGVGGGEADKFQFERLGYFAVDPDSTRDKLVFNRTATLRDSYSKGGNK
ncbi:hypothetical protein MKX03_034462 [Papaver bracteatum]|nr:hypothetical protein MKX03_034462 [Papaver bracteatum]